MVMELSARISINPAAPESASLLMVLLLLILILAASREIAPALPGINSGTALTIELLLIES